MYSVKCTLSCIVQFDGYRINVTSDHKSSLELGHTFRVHGVTEPTPREVVYWLDRVGKDPGPSQVIGNARADPGIQSAGKGDSGLNSSQDTQVLLNPSGRGPTRPYIGELVSANFRPRSWVWVSGTRLESRGYRSNPQGGCLPAR